ncbi:hypothetical protein ACFVYF_31185 [Streptomyces sp. NPDC058274]|uniref:hypothetical protein n=1 Tax=Streptomyces sp. NPDC058274 TaxID=3346416 RepID=UPI0036E78ED1
MPRSTGWRRVLTGVLAGLTATVGLTTALAAPATAATTTPVAVTKYSHTSQPGDYIGQGATASYTSKTATITAGGSAEYVRFRVWADDTWWDVDLAAPQGEKLHPGVYRDAERAAFRTGRSPGLDVSGDGRGCNEVFGQFSVNQIETDADGAITVLDATYTQHCESATAPALKGVVKYQAYPLSYAYTSDPGDYIGQGVSATHTGATSTFSLSGSADGVRYGVSGKREYWSASIAPPEGEQFKVGTTYATERFRGPGVGGLDLGGNGRGCNSSTGEFTVGKLALNGDGTVKAFAATFVQHCEGGTPALRGTIHYYA